MILVFFYGHWKYQETHSVPLLSPWGEVTNFLKKLMLKEMTVFDVRGGEDTFEESICLGDQRNIFVFFDSVVFC